MANYNGTITFLAEAGNHQITITFTDKVITNISGAYIDTSALQLISSSSSVFDAFAGHNVKYINNRKIYIEGEYWGAGKQFGQNGKEAYPDFESGQWCIVETPSTSYSFEYVSGIE